MARLVVGQGAVQTQAALGREEGDEALARGVWQGAPRELASSQRLPVDFHLFTRAPGDGHGRRSREGPGENCGAYSRCGVYTYKTLGQFEL